MATTIAVLSQKGGTGKTTTVRTLEDGDQVTIGRFDLYFLVLHGTGAPQHQRAPGAVA